MNKIKLINKISYAFYLKALTVFTLVTMLILPHMSWAFDMASYAAISNKTFDINLLKEMIADPGQLGLIKHSKQGYPKTVICIEDLHCHYEVQKNISKFIHYLTEHHHLKLIGEEGAFDTLDLSPLTSIPVLEVKKSVTDYFMRKGKISGVEYYAAVGDNPIVIEGIETPALYQESYELIKSFLNAESQGLVYDLRDMLEDAKTTLYNRPLQMVDQKTMNYREGKMDLHSYAAFLGKTAAKLGIDTHQFPVLFNFLYDEKNFFNNQKDPELLFEQLEQIKILVHEKLYTKDSQRELDALYERLNIVEKLLNISGTQEEVSDFFNHRALYQVDHFVKFMESCDLLDSALIGLEDLYRLDNYLTRVAEFYRLADERSKSFAENIIRKMELTDQQLAVMIIGGFHTQHVLQALSQKGVQAVAVKPKLTRLDYVNPYFSLLQQHTDRLEDLLANNQNKFAVRRMLQDAKNSTSQQLVFRKLVELHAKTDILARSWYRKMSIEKIVAKMKGGWNQYFQSGAIGIDEEGFAAANDAPTDNALFVPVTVGNVDAEQTSLLTVVSKNDLPETQTVFSETKDGVHYSVFKDASKATLEKIKESIKASKESGLSLFNRLSKIAKISLAMLLGFATSAFAGESKSLITIGQSSPWTWAVVAIGIFVGMALVRQFYRNNIDERFSLIPSRIKENYESLDKKEGSNYKAGREFVTGRFADNFFNQIREKNKLYQAEVMHSGNDEFSGYVDKKLYEMAKAWAAKMVNKNQGDTYQAVKAEMIKFNQDKKELEKIIDEACKATGHSKEDMPGKRKIVLQKLADEMPANLVILGSMSDGPLRSDGTEQVVAKEFVDRLNQVWRGSKIKLVDPKDVMASDLGEGNGKAVITNQQTGEKTIVGPQTTFLVISHRGIHEQARELIDKLENRFESQVFVQTTQREKAFSSRSRSLEDRDDLRVFETDTEQDDLSNDFDSIIINRWFLGDLRQKLVETGLRVFGNKGESPVVWDAQQLKKDKNEREQLLEEKMPEIAGRDSERKKTEILDGSKKVQDMIQNWLSDTVISFILKMLLFLPFVTFLGPDMIEGGTLLLIEYLTLPATLAGLVMKVTLILVILFFEMISTYFRRFYQGRSIMQRLGIPTMAIMADKHNVLFLLKYLIDSFRGSKALTDSNFHGEDELNMLHRKCLIGRGMLLMTLLSKLGVGNMLMCVKQLVLGNLSVLGYGTRGVILGHKTVESEKIDRIPVPNVSGSDSIDDYYHSIMTLMTGYKLWWGIIKKITGREYPWYLRWLSPRFFSFFNPAKDTRSILPKEKWWKNGVMIRVVSYLLPFAIWIGYSSVAGFSYKSLLGVTAFSLFANLVSDLSKTTTNKPVWKRAAMPMLAFVVALLAGSYFYPFSMKELLPLAVIAAWVINKTIGGPVSTTRLGCGLGSCVFGNIEEALKYANLHAMIRKVTQGRGSQAEGVAIYYKYNGEWQELVVKVIANRRETLSKRLTKEVTKGLKGLKARRQIDPDSPIVMMDHSRWATGSPTRMSDTQPLTQHEKRSVEVYEEKEQVKIVDFELPDDLHEKKEDTVKGTVEWKKRDAKSRVRIAANGDFDYIEIKGVRIDNGTAGKLLNKVLHSDNWVQSDSMKISGMLEWFLTQGMWGRSVRYSYYFGMLNTDLYKHVLGTEEDTHILTQAEENVLGRMFEIAFKENKTKEEMTQAMKNMFRDIDEKNTFPEGLTEKEVETFKVMIKRGCWVKEAQNEFISMTVEAFFDQDLYAATKLFLSMAKDSSFGLHVISLLNPMIQIIASSQLNVTVGVNRATGMFGFFSESSAPLLAEAEDGKWGYDEFIMLDSEGAEQGQVVEVGWHPEKGKKLELRGYSFKQKKDLIEEDLLTQADSIKNNPWFEKPQDLTPREEANLFAWLIKRLARIWGDKKLEDPSEELRRRINQKFIQKFMPMLTGRLWERYLKQGQVYRSIPAGIEAFSYKKAESLIDQLVEKASKDEQNAVRSLLEKKYFSARLVDGLDQALKTYMHDAIDKELCQLADQQALDLLDHDNMMDEQRTKIKVREEVAQKLIKQLENKAYGDLNKWFEENSEELLNPGENGEIGEESISAIIDKIISQFHDMSPPRQDVLTNDQTVDLFFTGQENNEYLSRELNKLLKRVIPGFLINVASSNLALNDMPNLPLGPRSMVFVLSQSTETFPVAGFTRVLTTKIPGMRDRVFLGTGKIASPLGKHAIGQKLDPQALQNDELLTGNIFYTGAPVTTSETSAATVMATRASLYILYKEISETILNTFHDRSEPDKAVSNAELLDKTSEEMTEVMGVNDKKEKEETKFNQELKKVTEGWGRKRKEVPFIGAALVVYVTLAIIFPQYFWFGNHVVAWLSPETVTGMAELLSNPVLSPTPGNFIQLLIFVFFTPGLFILVRLAFRHPLFARMFSNRRLHIIANDVDKVEEIYGAKLNGLARSTTGINTHASEEAGNWETWIWPATRRGDLIVAIEDPLDPKQKVTQSVKAGLERYKKKYPILFWLGARPEIMLIGAEEKVPFTHQFNVPKEKTAPPGIGSYSVAEYRKKHYEAVFSNLPNFATAQNSILTMEEKVTAKNEPFWKIWNSWYKNKWMYGTPIGQTQGTAGVQSTQCPQPVEASKVKRFLLLFGIGEPEKPVNPKQEQVTTTSGTNDKKTEAKPEETQKTPQEQPAPKRNMLKFTTIGIVVVLLSIAIVVLAANSAEIPGIELGFLPLMQIKKPETGPKVEIEPGEMLNQRRFDKHPALRRVVMGLNGLLVIFLTGLYFAKPGHSRIAEEELKAFNNLPEVGEMVLRHHYDTRFGIPKGVNKDKYLENLSRQLKFGTYSENYYWTKNIFSLCFGFYQQRIDDEGQKTVALPAIIIRLLTNYYGKKDPGSFDNLAGKLAEFWLKRMIELQTGRFAKNMEKGIAESRDGLDPIDGVLMNMPEEIPVTIDLNQGEDISKVLQKEEITLGPQTVPMIVMMFIQSLSQQHQTAMIDYQLLNEKLSWTTANQKAAIKKLEDGETPEKILAEHPHWLSKTGIPTLLDVAAGIEGSLAQTFIQEFRAVRDADIRYAGERGGAELLLKGRQGFDQDGLTVQNTKVKKMTTLAAPDTAKQLLSLLKTIDVNKLNLDTNTKNTLTIMTNVLNIMSLESCGRPISFDSETSRCLVGLLGTYQNQAKKADESSSVNLMQLGREERQGEEVTVYAATSARMEKVAIKRYGLTLDMPLIAEVTDAKDQATISQKASSREVHGAFFRKEDVSILVGEKSFMLKTQMLIIKQLSRWLPKSLRLKTAGTIWVQHLMPQAYLNYLQQTIDQNTPVFKENKMKSLYRLMFTPGTVLHRLYLELAATSPRDRRAYYKAQLKLIDYMMRYLDVCGEISAQPKEVLNQKKLQQWLLLNLNFIHHFVTENESIMDTSDVKGGMPLAEYQGATLPQGATERVDCPIIYFGGGNNTRLLRLIAFLKKNGYTIKNNIVEKFDRKKRRLSMAASA